MMIKKSKKQSPVGCVIFLVITAVLFFYLPWQVASGGLVVLFIISLISTGIGNDVRKIRSRNITRKSLISKASEGFTELVAKIRPTNDSLKTWLDEEPADYRWISFQRFYRPKNPTENDRPRWVSFFDHESEDRFLAIQDGSGTAFVSLHMVNFRIRSKSKKLKRSEVIQLLKERPIDGFDYQKVENEDSIRIEELWIPRGQYHYFYGDMYTFQDQVPEKLFERIMNAWRGGNYMNDQRKPLSEHWGRLQEKATALGEKKVKVLAGNYDQDPAEGVIVSRYDDGRLNLMSFLSIAGLVVALLFVLVMAFFLLRAEYPELVEKLQSMLNIVE